MHPYDSAAGRAAAAGSFLPVWPLRDWPLGPRGPAMLTELGAVAQWKMRSGAERSDASEL